jgi:hypothetical protein
VVVAGGGGGAGAIFSPNAAARGGDGGAATPGSSSSRSGGQGSASSGGAGGTSILGGSAAAGSFGVGGAGLQSFGSGGGGGGWYGGGGGGVDFAGTDVGYGGGGGSSYVVPSATDSTMTPGVREGDGRVTISYVVESGRAVDTRGGTRLAAGVARAIDLGSSGVPDDAVAVEINVTVDAPATAGYLVVFPCGSSVPSSNLNFAAGQTTSNSAIVPLATGGQLCVMSTAATDVLVDVLRYFDSSTDRLTAVAPVRLYDSRAARSSVIPAGSVTEVTAADLPSGTTSLVVHLTATQSASYGYVTAYACGTAAPNWSNLNTEPGRDVANRATVDLPDHGALCVYNSSATHLVVDLDAAYTGSTGASITAKNPERIRDTRFGARPDAAAVTEVGVGAAGITAAALNVTVDGADTPGYLTVWPCDQPKPATSNGNYVAGTATASALTIAASATGTICVATSTAAHVIIDLQARFTTPI